MEVPCPALKVTVPDPDPAIVRPRVNCDTSNVAVQLRAAAIDTVVDRALPLQSPLQPVNVDPLAASAVSVTSVPVS